jgi:hypothetical protein
MFCFVYSISRHGLSKDITNFVFEWATTKNSGQPTQFLGFGKDRWIYYLQIDFKQVQSEMHIARLLYINYYHLMSCFDIQSSYPQMAQFLWPD